MSFQTRSKNPGDEVRFNNHRLMSGELKPHEQSLRFIDIRLIFAHDDEGYQATKARCQPLGLGTRLVLVFAPLSAFRTQSDSLYLDGKRAYGCGNLEYRMPKTLKSFREALTTHTS